MSVNIPNGIKPNGINPNDYRQHLQALVTERLPRFCANIPPRQAALFFRLALSHFRAIPDEELMALRFHSETLSLALVFGQMFARLAHAIWEEERRSEDTRFYAHVLTGLSAGLDGNPLGESHLGAEVANRSTWVLGLHRALTDLARSDLSAHHVISLRYFGGHTLNEVANKLELGMTIVRRLEKTGHQFIRERLLGDV